MIKSLLATSLPVALLAYIVFPLSIDFDSEDLNGRVALVTGGSRGSGRGFVHGLLEARATVYVTGRTRESLEKTCETSKRPDLCKIRVLDNSNDQELEDLFLDIMEIEGRLDVLVNNAYSALGYWRRRELLGKPFWETDVELYDAVHDVGVRSHYRASVLAVRIMRNQARGGVIVNTNSPGCLLYSMNVPYGMGKCAIDKMSADMSVELDFDSSDVTVVSWWPKSPMRTEEIRTVDDGRSSRRGNLPGMGFLRFDQLYDTALAGSLLMEGRALATFVRDRSRNSFSGLAVQSAQLASRYNLRDERQIRSPPLLSLKFLLFLFRPLHDLTKIESGGGVASALQQFLFGTLPDISIPQFIPKLVQGTPLTIKWFL
eukprot:g6108.t1